MHVHDDKHKVLKQLQANQIEDQTVLDIKNGSTMCKNPPDFTHQISYTRGMFPKAIFPSK